MNTEAIEQITILEEGETYDGKQLKTRLLVVDLVSGCRLHLYREAATALLDELPVKKRLSSIQEGDVGAVFGEDEEDEGKEDEGEREYMVIPANTFRRFKSAYLEMVGELETRKSC